jgi:hypothetical protein
MSRYASLIAGLERRHNDSLAAVDPVQLARQFNLPAELVRRKVANEIARRQA